MECVDERYCILFSFPAFAIDMPSDSSKNSILAAVIDVTAFLLYSAYLILRSIVELCLPSSYEPKKEVKGEVVLVTGGGGGLGQLLALRLSKLGAIVVIWDISEEGKSVGVMHLETFSCCLVIFGRLKLEF